MQLLATDTIENTFGKVTTPPQLGDLGSQPGNIAISLFLSRAINIIYMLAGLLVVFMFISGAVMWIISGGEKEKVEEARKRIMAAVIGVILLALAFVILGVLGGILGFQFFAGQNIPGFNCAPNCAPY